MRNTVASGVDCIKLVDKAITMDTITVSSSKRLQMDRTTPTV